MEYEITISPSPAASAPVSAATAPPPGVGVQRLPPVLAQFVELLRCMAQDRDFDGLEMIDPGGNAREGEVDHQGHGSEPFFAQVLNSCFRNFST